MSNVRAKWEYLLERGLLSETDFLRALSEAQAQKAEVEQVLLRGELSGKVPREEIGAALASYYKCRYVAFDPRAPAPRALLRNLKPVYLRTNHWVPLEQRGGRVAVLIDDPNHLIKRDGVEALLQTTQIEYCVGLRDDIRAYIDSFFGAGPARQAEAATADQDGQAAAPSPGNEDVQTQVAAETGAGQDTGGTARELPAVSSEQSIAVEVGDLADEQVIAELLAEIVGAARGRGASEIHVEPYPEDDEVAVRLRIDGVCTDYQIIPGELRQALAAHVKERAGLDPGSALPQEGRLRLRLAGGVEADLRVSTLPLAGGAEDVVLRLLTPPAPLAIGRLGLARPGEERLLRLLRHRRGLVLVAGPAGAGRTTTLHAAAAHLNRPDLKIGTVEDPVEIRQTGLRQVQVDAQAGFGTAAALRALLRTDPDVVLVGEVADGETGTLVSAAAAARQLVLAGVQAGGAAEAVARLCELGVEAGLVAEALRGVVAQRLVRRLCPACKAAVPVDGELRALCQEEGVAVPDAARPFRARGCERCSQTGYAGRMAVAEVMEAGDALRGLVQQRRPVAEVRARARQDGMVSLRADALGRVLEGETDLYEVRAGLLL